MHKAISVRLTAYLALKLIPKESDYDLKRHYSSIKSKKVTKKIL